MAAHSPGFINIPSPSVSAKIAVARKEEGLHVLKNNSGMKAAITNYGGKLVSLIVPDPKGRRINVIAGFTEEKNQDEKSYRDTGWDTGMVSESTLELTCFSNPVNERFPGYPLIKVQYILTDDNRLKITYEATIEQINALNLSNKLSFNLNGAGSGSILNHLVQINADNYIPVNGHGAATWEKEPVSGGPFDFRKATTIGARINDNNWQLKNGKGYNHIFILNKHSNRTPIARIKGDKSGIIMEICTEQQGLYFYSCNLMQSATEQNGDCRNAFALAATHFPRQFNTHLSPNGQFDDDQIYKFNCVYRFKTGK